MNSGNATTQPSLDTAARRRHSGGWSAVGLTALSLLGSLAVLGAGSALNRGDQPAAGQAGADHAARVERGRYLVSIMACNDCHTPWKMGANGPEPDMSRMLSGHPRELVMPPAPKLGDGPWVWVGAGTNTAFSGPWGTSYTANLTPDPSGLAIWTEDMFVRAIRTGKHMGEPTSRDIQPPMPWPIYRNASDDDLRAIFAYLRTIPPVRNDVPAYAPPVQHRS